MKLTPQLKAAQEQMKPGVISRDGFLGTDLRTLADILVADDAEVQRLEMTHRQLAKRMRDLFQAGKKGLGDPIDVEENFEITVTSHRGKMPCPFGHAGIFRKTVITVLNKKLGKTVKFTELGIHLIEKHGFYQGVGASYRLSPQDIVTILEVPNNESA